MFKLLAAYAAIFLIFAFWIVVALGTAALPCVLVWYLVTH